MSYGTWLLAAVASAVAGADVELCQRLAPFWRRITELVVSFFGPRLIAGRGPEV